MSATTKQVIIGLYAAFFNRAPDESGLNFWLRGASESDSKSTFKELATGFSSHPKFADIYDGMSNQQFVEEIYKDVLGFRGDAAGIAYWVDVINSDFSRSDMVAEFVEAALNIDLNDEKWNSLTVEEKTIAQNRQDVLTNKVEVSQYFIEKNAGASNVIFNNDLDNDSAYLASIAAIKNVDNTTASVMSAKLAIDNFKPADTGVVIDGYIKEATVFIDANGNGKLEDGEKSVVTDA